MVAHEECVGHVGELLAVLVGQVERAGLFVRHYVVHKACAGGAGVAKPHHLHRGRAEGEDLVTRTLRVAVHVDQDVDTVRVDPVGGLV